MTTTIAKAFAGELGLVGLFDLGQLLTLNRATGCLAIEHEGRRGYLYFEDGQVVNALDDEQREGEGAAYRVFSWKSGHFEFRPEPPGAPHTIQESTEALMLEAARRMDEAGEAGKPAGSETARLLDRQNAMEALREVFHLVAREARDADGAAAEPANLLLEALRDPDDRLLCRRGRPPRLLHDGSWLVASEAPLDHASYDELRARLLGGDEPILQPFAPVTMERGTNRRQRLVTIEGGRSVSVTAVGSGTDEALWIRSAALQPPEMARLEGHLERLHALLGIPQGLVLTCGPSAEAVELLLHALVSILARLRGGTVLLVTDDPAYSHEEDAGVVLRAGHGEATNVLRAILPSVVVFDALRPDSAAVLEALRAVPLVLAGMVTMEPELALRRWLAGLEGEKSAIEALLASSAVGLAFTPGVPLGEDRIPFSARMLSGAAGAPGPRGASAGAGSST